ncbi:efflux transporter outer membrane subunit [Hyphomicrobium sp.]|uniref:efflux transporter outer membrane subunit n=1 Tax=Hyphomicrobium sp. TaxID=82 RepID=UPI001D6C4AE4|nr:efflux transporter outer membrane subunit [Hyphomicrobium sp.]MBY0558315.1 efflux transporter outer membrane subunit [Hyphomicrobium sp.]
MVKVILQAIGICLPLLAGCTVGPDYHLPGQALVNALPADAAFASKTGMTSSGEPAADWWRLYDDTTLSDLVERALRANTDLRIAEANLEQAHALLAEAETGRQINGSAAFETSYVQQSAEANLSHIKPPQHQIANLGIAINYDLDLFGGIKRGTESASANDEAAVAARDLVRVNVVADTTRAYADICNSGSELESARRTAAIQLRTISLTRTMATNGRVASFDIDREEGLYRQFKSQIPMLEARQINAAYRLTTLIGQLPESYDRSLLNCRRPLKLASKILVGDAHGLLSRRPDVRAAERRLAASTAMIGVATAELYPDVKIGASIGTQGAATDLFGPLTNRFGVGPMISWNVNHNVARARVAGAEARSNASLALFDKTVLVALREIESAMTNYAYSLERLENLRHARDRAGKVATDARRLWQGGSADALTSLDADRSLAAAEQAYAAGQTDVSQYQIAIFLALGGSWQVPQVQKSRLSGNAVSQGKSG